MIITINNENTNISTNNNPINNSIYSSTNSVINNPIVMKLIESGIEPKYSKRIFHYYHPSNIDDALNYLILENGIIQHYFVQDRKKLENVNCYLCGNHKNNHLGSIPLNNNFNKSNEKNLITSSYNNNSQKDEIKNSIENNSKILENRNVNDLKSSQKNNENNECPICEESFYIDDNNKLKNCGHSFCNNCWYNYFSINIQENKLDSIKCLDYECQEKPDDNY